MILTSSGGVVFCRISVYPNTLQEGLFLLRTWFQKSPASLGPDPMFFFFFGPHGKLVFYGIVYGI